jgi:Chaperone of endosialidase
LVSSSSSVSAILNSKSAGKGKEGTMNPLETVIRPVLIVLGLTFLALAPTVQAVVPSPDGAYPGFNTAEGQNALFNLTTGVGNTAVGWLSLRALTTGQFNTGVGAGTLARNTADQNTATGAGALLSNTTGSRNAANGAFALFGNTEGAFNTAIGAAALRSNTTGLTNTAIGHSALDSNTTGELNTALGNAAGINVITANNVICISHPGEDVSDTTWIGNIYNTTTVSATTLPVVVSNDNQLGTMSSSARFKKEIKAMDKTSESILGLKPVTFHYKSDKTNTAQFGLIAEEVAEVNPDLIVRDKKGDIYSVRYDAVNAMLLNEFLKEHKAFVKEQRKVQEQGETIACLQKQIEAVTATLQKVSAQLATANGAAGMRSDIDGSSREAEMSGSK